ncbi:MAG: hypothetical protein JO012_23325, partial [Hyphomicrobiales bacterium]|nr:hypothetical protein [Hyphomicrobiales bacterium]
MASGPAPRVLYRRSRRPKSTHQLNVGGNTDFLNLS